MDIKIIAHIKTDFPEKFGIPRQSNLIKGTVGRIIFESKYRNPDAVRGLEAFSHVWILWGFSKTEREDWSPTVFPPRLGGKKKMGVFATRSPYRPNAIALSSVKLEKIELDPRQGPIITVSGIDMLDGSPIYDIKPYLPHSDCHTDAIGGFSEEVLGHSLEVHFPDELLTLIAPDDRDTVIEILREDPRTAYIHDERRVWGFTYSRYNIEFVVHDNAATVVTVTYV